ncbi:MAG TPA: GNAT family N-acetyltransferase [Caulobacter sp.]|nr:GNAT family N-acetyltransferase [Caulobacter sp.]
MKIDVVRPWELTAFAVERWAALQTADPALESPFLSPHWARAVARAKGPSTGDRGLRVAVLGGVEDPKGFLAAQVGPFTAMPAGAPMCDYQGLVAEPGLEIDPREIVAALGVGRLDFCHMLEGQTAFAPHAKGAEPSRIIDVSGGYAAYETERRAAGVSALKDIDKKRRKVERELGPVTFTAFSRSKTDFDQLVEWKRKAWRETGQTDLFSAGWPLRLLRQLFASRDPDFGGVLFTLHIGETLAAAQLDIRGGATVHSWIIGHDSAFDRYSPGMMLFQDILRWMDTVPYSRLDLGSGDYRFKRELANAQVEVSHGFVGGLSAAAMMREAAYGLRRVAESLPLGPVSELPAKAMRRMDLLRGLR